MIHVLIRRRIAEGMLSTYEEASRNILHASYIAPGFISGEAFSDINNPNHRFLICKFKSVKDWQRWLHSEQRTDLMNSINPILSEPENITILAN